VARLDLLFLPIDVDNGQPRLVFSRTGTPPLAQECSGEVKLAQRWLLEFLTKRGSIPHKPQRGCSFLSELESGLVHTETDVFAAFATAQVQIEQNLASDARADDPPEELFAEAELTRLSISDTLLHLQISIVSRAGTELTLGAAVVAAAA
jgi:hypothetical protein